MKIENKEMLSNFIKAEQEKLALSGYDMMKLTGVPVATYNRNLRDGRYEIDRAISILNYFGYQIEITKKEDHIFDEVYLLSVEIAKRGKGDIKRIALEKKRDTLLKLIGDEE